VIWRRLAVTTITLKPTPPATGTREKLLRGHEGTPDSLHIISFQESETVDCDGQQALAQGPTPRISKVD
jgi:hypothetical protein